MTVLRDYAAAVTQPSLGDDPPPFDEVAGPDGSLREPWRRLAVDAVDLTFPELKRVHDEISRFLADEGVTFTPPGREQLPWRLDPLPFVISADEWAGLEKGLAQRTELLNAILVDLYGPQKLLSSGVLPPSVVFGHSGYLRVVARASTSDRQPLVIAAADLGRRADGEWQVLADRAQAPSGIGFAMENRRVMSRVLPEAYRAAGLHRLAPFFPALRSALLQTAPDGIENPRVVVLSPGPMSETAYDQAFVAANLGFPLVEGSDLTVREGAVWMRVLGRLERVDVILRRVDSTWSDPLELRGESHLGVAGLTEAVRRGTVRVVNGLGSGVLENPALLPFMSAMCEFLLEESLRLPSIGTYWAGDPAGREQLLDRIDDLRVRSIEPPFDPGQLSREELIRQIEAAPHRFVGQEDHGLSVSPTLDLGGLRPHEVRLRTFTMRYGSSYRPMVGGLATAMPTVEDTEVHGISKDVWVMKSRPDEPDQGLAEVLPVTSVRAPVAMVPRVLDDLFWLGRYCERTEDTLRLIIATHQLSEDFRGRPFSSGGQTLHVMTEAMHALSASPVDPEAFDEDFRSLLLDQRRPGGVAQSIGRLKEIGQSARDHVSGDLFRVFGAIDRASAALVDNPHSWQIGESAGRMLTDVLALGGITNNMMRDAGWHLIEAGRAIERSVQLCHLVGSALTVRRGIDVDRDVNNAVLQTAESAIAHRRRYRGFVRVSNVLELLLLDGDNPRSLLFNVRAIDAHLSALPGSTGSTRPERLVDELLEDLDRIDIAALITIEGEGRPNLGRYTASAIAQLSRLSDAVGEVHFATGPAQRRLGFTAAES